MGVSTVDKGEVATDASVQYLWDPKYIDSPILRWRNANTSNADLEEVLYCTTDANMNVTALVDNSGQVVERDVYAAYGTATILDPNGSPRTGSASAVANEVGYSGYRKDPETGLWYVRMRYLQPTLTLWLQRDPLPEQTGQYPDGMHLYQYVRSSPVNLVDPSGQQALQEAITIYLNRVFGTQSYLLKVPHPTTYGPGPLAAGVLWGILQAQADAGKEITSDLVISRSIEFGAIPAAAGGAALLYSAVPNAATSAIWKWSAVGARTSLYAAAVYVGWQIGTAINNRLDDLEDEAWYNINKEKYIEGMRLQGRLLATILLKNAPKIRCGNKVMQLNRSTPRKCADKLVDRFGAAVGYYGILVWNDVIGETYADAKARKGQPGSEDPKRRHDMVDRLETAINRYYESVREYCGGRISPYASD